MLRYIFPALLLIACSACSESGRGPAQQAGGPSDTDTALADPKNKLNVQTPQAVEIDSSGIFMFPLVMGETDGEGRAIWGRSTSSYKEMPESSYWNIIFLNGATGQYHLLSEQKMLIRSYLFDATQFGREADWAKAPSLIFYRITAADYNRDKLLTHDDPVYLYVTDRQGRGFRQISPPDHHLISWDYAASVQKVIMTLRKDSDRNGTFEEEDEITTYTIDPAGPGGQLEVLSPEFKNKLRKLFDRDWRRVK